MSTMLGEISVKELHGPWSDFMDKLQGEESALWFAAFKRFLRRENPWDGATKKDRITFTVTGLGLTGVEWVTRLESGGHKLSYCAQDIITKPDYDQNHRLEVGKEYRVTLILGKEIKKDKDRYTANLQLLATFEIGEQSVIGLKGELVLLIREKFTNAELKAMGICYITVLHEPIIGSGGDTYILRSDCLTNDSFVNATHVTSSDFWRNPSAFAFLEEL